jgi:phage shock protein C
METTTDSATTRLTKDSADAPGRTEPTDPVFGPAEPAGAVFEATGPAGPAYDASSAPSYPALAPEPTARPKFRLRRSRTDRMLGGVCGGLAESLGVDAAVVRIGLVTLTVLGAGSGVILYAAVWMLAPETDEP